MTLSLQDDDCVHAHERLEDVLRDVEPLDAEAVLREVYDDAGMRYAILWIRPNGPRGLSVANGVYELVPVGEDRAGLRTTIERARAVFPVSAEPAVRALAR